MQQPEYMSAPWRASFALVADSTESNVISKNAVKDFYLGKHFQTEIYTFTAKYIIELEIENIHHARNVIRLKSVAKYVLPIDINLY